MKHAKITLEIFEADGEKRACTNVVTYETATGKGWIGGNHHDLHEIRLLLILSDSLDSWFRAEIGRDRDRRRDAIIDKQFEREEAKGKV